jgi:signal transduction histidine kinase
VPVFPLACAVALLRHQLFDLDIVLNRGLVYVTLSAGVFAVYLVIVESARAVVGNGSTLVASLLAAAFVALVFAPSRDLVQRGVSTVMFGTRHDHSRTLSTLTTTLETSDDELGAAVTAIGQSLRLPHVMLCASGRNIGSGDDRSPPERFELRYRDQNVGELCVWPRRGQAHLDPDDVAAIRILVGPLATAVHALELSDALHASQQRLIHTREAERTRLHRDIHDGLGPILTAIALKADAAGNVVGQDPAKAHLYLHQIADEARSAVTEVRRLAHGLQPPALARHGLLDSLTLEAAKFTSRLDGHPLHVATHLPSTLPTLPDGVAAATFRIAAECLTNIARHSKASNAVVSLCCGDRLTLVVSDDGAIGPGAWTEGFGMASMRNRVKACGGRMEAGPGPAGGRVSIELPLRSEETSR